MSKRGIYTIEIGGEERTGRFTGLFWENLETDYGKSVGELLFTFAEHGMGFKEINSIVYCSLKAHAQVQEQVFKHNKAQVAEWLEDVTDEQKAEIIETFFDSKQVGKMLEAAQKITEEISKENAKKKNLEVNEEEIKKK